MGNRRYLKLTFYMPVTKKNKSYVCPTGGLVAPLKLFNYEQNWVWETYTKSYRTTLIFRRLVP
jgi:hypothetical protein